MVIGDKERVKIFLDKMILFAGHIRDAQKKYPDPPAGGVRGFYYSACRNGRMPSVPKGVLKTRGKDPEF